MSTYAIAGTSFADLGLTALRRLRRSLAPDSVTFLADGANLDSELALDYGDLVAITQDANPWFTGRVVSIPAQGSGSAESISYELAGPWWYLENLVFMQRWVFYRKNPAVLIGLEEKIGEKTLNGTLYDIITDYSSKIVLGQTRLGVRQTIGESIAEVIAYAIAAGAPMQAAAIDIPIYAPLDEQLDATCADTIRRLLRWVPDAVTWFDYATTPPTFHCARRAVLSETTLALTSLSSLTIAPRPDLQISSVVLKYHSLNETTVDGKSYSFPQITYDKYPADATGREPGAVVATIELPGSSWVVQKTTIESVALVNPGASAAFWRDHFAAFADDTVFGIEIVPGTAQYLLSDGTPSSLPYELKSGAIAPWMDKESDECTVSATVKLSIKNDEGEVVEDRIDHFACTITATDAASGEYRTMSGTAGETIVAGLAQALYEAAATLQYEGAATLEHAEPYSVAPGAKLNITGGRPEWAAMLALIQQIDEDVDSGRVIIQFGPPSHIAIQDLVELLRCNRGRRLAYSAALRVAGYSTA